MKSLLLLVAISTLAYGQITLNVSVGNQADIPIVVNEGNNVTLRCVFQIAGIVDQYRLPGNDNFGTNRPSNVIRNDDANVVTLTLVNAQRSDDSLAIHCSLGGSTTDNGIINVYYAPSFTNPGPQTLTENVNALVNVSLDANPIPGFTWTRDGMDISAGNVDQNESFIAFNPPRREDTGTYTIVAWNNAGSGNTTFEVTVNYIPTFDIGTGNLTSCRVSSVSSDLIICAIMTGGNGLLGCSAVGSPTPSVTATGDSSSSTIQFMNNGFFITGADTGTAGNYSCNASNSLGFEVRTFQLWVGGTPILNSLQIILGEVEVTVEWVFDGRGVPVSLFDVNIVCGSQQFSENVPVPETGDQATFTRALSSYPTDTSCEVTVSASNLLGRSSGLTDTFMTPTAGTEMTTAPGTTPTSGGAAFSAAIFSVLLLMIASLVF